MDQLDSPNVDPADEVAELEAIAEELETRELEYDLRSFIPQAWPIVEPNKQYMPNWHIDAISDHLMACHEGHIKKLAINIPPRHMKSNTVSVFYPAWVWITKPQKKWLFVSYSRSLVTRDAVKTRRILSSDWYQHRWGEKWNFAGDQNVKTYYENDKGGARIVGSIEAGITGEGGDYVVVDDPLKLEDSENMNAIINVNEYWDGVLASRLNDPENGVRIIIMQRLHEIDLTGHVLREGGWTHLYLPTKYEPSRACVTHFKRTIQEIKVDDTNKVVSEEKVVERTFQDPRTKQDELLNPDRFGPTQVEEIRIRNGEWKFAGQQQQNPYPKGGGMFKRSWWQFYDVNHTPSIDQMKDDGATAWDCSFKDVKTASYVVGLTGARISAAQIIILDRYRERHDLPGTLNAITAVKNRYSWIGAILVEDKANGPAVISVLKNKIPGIIPRNPGMGGIEALANAVTYMVEAGNVYLPGKRDEHGNLVAAYPWVEEFISEAAAFPRSEHTDQVAALAHLLYWYHERQATNVNLGDWTKAGKMSREEIDELGGRWIF